MAEIKTAKLPKHVENEKLQRKLAGSGEQRHHSQFLGITMACGCHHGQAVLLLAVLFSLDSFAASFWNVLNRNSDHDWLMLGVLGPLWLSPLILTASKILIMLT